MKIVAIKQMSAGNESVGEMWQEAKAFEPNTPVGDIIAWAKGISPTENLNAPRLRRHVIITDLEGL